MENFHSTLLSCENHESLAQQKNLSMFTILHESFIKAHIENTLTKHFMQ